MPDIVNIFEAKARKNQSMRRVRQIKWVDETYAIPQTEWLIDGILPRNAHSLLYGPPGSGKTFLAIDWACHVSCGEAWSGRPVDGPGAVVYIAAENPASVARRALAWRWAHPEVAERMRFAIVEGRVSALVEEDVIGTYELIDGVASEHQVLMVVIDTLARVLAGGDENSAEIMGRAIGLADGLRNRYGAHVMFVHHPGKDAAKGARGSSALKAGVDTEIELSRHGESRIITVRKQRDANEGVVGSFNLAEVSYGEVETCVLKHRPGIPPGMTGRPRSKSNALEKVGLDLLHELLGRKQLPTQAQREMAGRRLREGQYVALLEDWKEALQLAMEQGDGGKARGQRVRRTMEGLAGRGVVVVMDPLVWLRTGAMGGEEEDT